MIHGKWKANESLTERIKQVFCLVKRLQLQITTIHIPGKLNLTTDSLKRLCRSGDYTPKERIIQMICKTWNYMPQIDIFATQYNKLININVAVDLNDMGDTLSLRVQLQMKQSQTIYPSSNTSNKQYVTEIEIRQSTGNNNSTDLAGTIVVLQTKEFIHQIPFSQIIRYNFGDWIENEGQGSKTSTRECGRLPSGPVADVGRDLILRCMKIRGFSEDGENLLFNGQKFNILMRDFDSLALQQYQLDRQRETIEEVMKKDAEVILTEVIAFHTRQNNQITSAKSHKACLITMYSFIFRENLTTLPTSGQINKALANAIMPYRRY
ncbi:MAG: hypothetical protein EZS28_011650 [Streblomastix strix]|uniref:Uncharacterized protein n=1 Tax=Streblomastix strix TaxID=222440 RepID=A0A5J4WE61_9EUKA|nr:MAG: hypothetical protein EZS28_011650 [Streblomastix strix]